MLFLLLMIFIQEKVSTISHKLVGQRRSILYFYPLLKLKASLLIIPLHKNSKFMQHVEMMSDSSEQYQKRHG